MMPYWRQSFREQPIVLALVWACRRSGRCCVQRIVEKLTEKTAGCKEWLHDENRYAPGQPLQINCKHTFRRVAPPTASGLTLKNADGTLDWSICTRRTTTQCWDVVVVVFVVVGKQPWEGIAN